MRLEMIDNAAQFFGRLDHEASAFTLIDEGLDLGFEDGNLGGRERDLILTFRTPQGGAIEWRRCAQLRFCTVERPATANSGFL
jgi:hypothetical protein